MKLIYAQGACSLSVHILLEELGSEYEGVKVSLTDKKVLESYTPKSYVPALVLDSGEVMTEATSLLQYVSLENGGAFMPNDKLELARCIEWMTYVSTELHKGSGPLFHRDDLSEKYINSVMEKLGNRLQLLEDHLDSNAFIMGHDYTVADMYFLAILRILEHVQVRLDEYLAINNYKKNLEASPVIKKVLEEEQRAPQASEEWDPSSTVIPGQSGREAPFSSASPE